jgi:thiosulfate/3-mercaptopyruvate sulfurtransferase
MNALKILLFAGVLAAMPAEASAPFRTTFCPECWEFAGNETSLDRSGRCPDCGLVPVGVEGINLDWFWCSTDEVWRRQPCAREPQRQCCLRRSATAMVVFERGDEIFPAWYCPECRRIQPSEYERESARCSGCGKRFATADVLYRRWYRCKAAEDWLDEPCPSSRGRRCCEERAGMILAFPFVPPVPRPIPASYVPEPSSSLLVSTAWLEPRLGMPDLVVVHVGFGLEAADASGRSDYLDGHVPEARFLAWGDLVRTRDGLPNEMPPLPDLVAAVRRLGIDENDRVILYDTGSGLEAARAFVTFEYLGMVENLALLDGQWKKWAGEGRAASRMPAEFEVSLFLPRPRSDVIAPLRAVKDLAWLAAQPGGSAVLFDARPEAEYSGEKAGKGVARPGHIPGAASVCWMQQLRPGSFPLLRSEEELRDLFESAGARPGRTLVAYCRTGVQASHTYFVARLLGYDARLYDGSFVEWSGRPELPVSADWAGR